MKMQKQASRTMKRAIALGMSLALAASSVVVLPSTGDAAQKKPTLSAKKKTLTYNQASKKSFTLKIKKNQAKKIKKTTWSTSKKSIVSISKKKATSVKVTAKKKGTAKITATVKYTVKGKKTKTVKLTCKITSKKGAAGSASTNNTTAPANAATTAPATSGLPSATPTNAGGLNTTAPTASVQPTNDSAPSTAPSINPTTNTNPSTKPSANTNATPSTKPSAKPTPVIELLQGEKLLDMNENTVVQDGNVEIEFNSDGSMTGTILNPGTGILFKLPEKAVYGKIVYTDSNPAGGFGIDREADDFDLGGHFMESSGIETIEPQKGQSMSSIKIFHAGEVGNAENITSDSPASLTVLAVIYMPESAAQTPTATPAATDAADAETVKLNIDQKPALEKTGDEGEAILSVTTGSGVSVKAETVQVESSGSVATGGAVEVTGNQIKIPVKAIAEGAGSMKVSIQVEAGEETKTLTATLAFSIGESEPDIPDWKDMDLTELEDYDAATGTLVIPDSAVTGKYTIPLPADFAESYRESTKYIIRIVGSFKTANTSSLRTYVTSEGDSSTHGTGSTSYTLCASSDTETHSWQFLASNDVDSTSDVFSIMLKPVNGDKATMAGLTIQSVSIREYTPDEAVDANGYTILDIPQTYNGSLEYYDPNTRSISSSGIGDMMEFKLPENMAKAFNAGEKGIKLCFEGSCGDEFIGKQFRYCVSGGQGSWKWGEQTSHIEYITPEQNIAITDSDALVFTKGSENDANSKDAYVKFVKLSSDSVLAKGLTINKIRVKLVDIS